MAFLTLWLSLPGHFESLGLSCPLHMMATAAYIEEAVIHFGTELQALKVKMALSCHADYRWICVKKDQSALVLSPCRDTTQLAVRTPGRGLSPRPTTPALGR